MSNTTPERSERPDPTRPMPQSTGSTIPGASGTSGQTSPGTSGPATSRSSGPATPSYAAPPATSSPARPGPGEQAEPETVRGPYLATVLIGIVCLAVAGLVIAQEIGGLSIDWGNVGPLGIVAAGAVLVVLGLLGLLSSRRRR